MKIKPIVKRLFPLSPKDYPQWYELYKDVQNCEMPTCLLLTIYMSGEPEAREAAKTTLLNRIQSLGLSGNARNCTITPKILYERYMAVFHPKGNRYNTVAKVGGVPGVLAEDIKQRDLRRQIRDKEALESDALYHFFKLVNTANK